MLVDLDKLRPRNESYEHFLLKQVARAWLFKKGVKISGCEVYLKGEDVSPFGEKSIVDVVGIERRRKRSDALVKLYSKIYDLALQKAIAKGLTSTSYGGSISFISTYNLKGEAKMIAEAGVESCFEEACVDLKLPREHYKKLRGGYKQEYFLYSCESKASLSDFKNGFSVTADYAYIIAPKGVIPHELIPNEVGLLEFDFAKFADCKDWERCLKSVKKAKRHFDGMFLSEVGNQKSVIRERHEDFCKELVYSISQEGTEEAVFWNPYLRDTEASGRVNEASWMFKYKIGDVTPLGIVIDRRIGEKKADELAHEKSQGIRSYTGRNTAYYKLVVPNEGITPWVAQFHLNLSQV